MLVVGSPSSATLNASIPMQRVLMVIAFSSALALAAAAQTGGSAQNSPATQAYLQAMGDMTDKMKDMTPSGDPSTGARSSATG